ncbi:MAG TPA: LysR family transcriptional regulator [Mesorhizobium sp.]|jgi:DNA-binding transcriptional LysR family regulator|nr:LysR family transcriptional regulator [Mesorhizobium sp.]
MSELDDIQAFVQVAETLSLSRAAVKLHVTKSVVSRRIARLEQSLGGVSLVSRTTRGASLTEAGREFERRCREVLAGLEDARNAVMGRAGSELAGALRLSAPLAFGTRHLSSVLTAFAARHPALVLDVHYAERAVDLVTEGFDMAVRIGSLRDSSLVGRRLCPVRNVLVASPAYLERQGIPRTPQEIMRHDCLVSTHTPVAEHWRFLDGGRWISLHPSQVRLRADNGDVLKDAAVAGLGLAVMPSFIASEAIGRGELQVVLGRYALPERSLHILRPPGRKPAPAVRALFDHLAENFGPEPTWDPCWRACALEGRDGPAAPEALPSAA